MREDLELLWLQMASCYLCVWDPWIIKLMNAYIVGSRCFRTASIHCFLKKACLTLLENCPVWKRQGQFCTKGYALPSIISQQKPSETNHSCLNRSTTRWTRSPVDIVDMIWVCGMTGSTSTLFGNLKRHILFIKRTCFTRKMLCVFLSAEKCRWMCIIFVPWSAKRQLEKLNHVEADVPSWTVAKIPGDTTEQETTTHKQTNPPTNHPYSKHKHLFRGTRPWNWGS